MKSDGHETTLKQAPMTNQPGLRNGGHHHGESNMFARSLSLLALTAFVAAAAVPPALAGSCCGCAYTCAQPAQVQIWGLSPSYVVNQGPVFTGPGFYTSPTYEGETSTVDYPYVGYGDYPRYHRPYDGGLYADPFRHRPYHRYWQSVLPERRHHFEMLREHETGVLYRHGFGPRAITMSRSGHWVAHNRDIFRDRRDR
jgi:hypothetical protein